MNSAFSNVSSFPASRLSSLFSDFSHLKDVNVEGYNANISSWELLLTQCLREHTFQSSISLPKDRLLEVLASPQYGPPKSLQLVIDTLVNRHVFIPWSIYKQNTVGFSSWFAGLSPRNLWPSLMGSLGLVAYTEKDIGEFYIHWPSLIVHASKVIKHLEQLVESECCYSARLFDLEMFRNLLRRFDEYLSDIDIEALLTYLSRNSEKIKSQKIISLDNKCQNYIIKFGNNQVIEPEDSKIIEIKSTISTIERRIEVLDRSMHTDISQQIKHLIATQAPELRLKALLNKRRQLGKSLEAALSVSSQLNVLLSKIDDSHANGLILDSLHSAKTVLSLLNKEGSMINFDEFVAELDTLIASTDDVSRALGVSFGKSDDDDLVEGTKENAKADNIKSVGALSPIKKRTEFPSTPLQDTADTTATVKEAVSPPYSDDTLNGLNKELNQLRIDESFSVSTDSGSKESKNKNAKTKLLVPA